MKTPPPTIQIGLFLYRGCMPSGLFAFADLLQASNQRAGRPAFATHFVAIEGQPVACAHGHIVAPAATVAAMPLDIVVLPPAWTASVQDLENLAAAHAPVVAALGTLRKGTMLMAYCSGVALLAASGRLDGQAATVSWWLADLLRKQYPRIDWKIEQNAVINKRTASAADRNGHMLLAQDLIERHIGQEVYQSMVTLMNLPRPGYTHEAFRAMDVIQQGNDFMRQLFLTVQNLPATHLTVRKLADELNTAERTLARRVNMATGEPVASYLRRIKLNQVSERLIQTTSPASSISAALGFSSESSMRRMFKDLTGLTPQEYRSQFRRQ